MLLRNRKEESDPGESFEVCSSLITAVRNIFIQTKIQMDCIFVEYHIVRKTVTFGNEGTFTLASSGKDVHVIF